MKLISKVKILLSLVLIVIVIIFIVIPIVYKNKNKEHFLNYSFDLENVEENTLNNQNGDPDQAKNILI